MFIFGNTYCINNILIFYNVEFFEIACFIKETKKKFWKSEKHEKYKKINKNINDLLRGFLLKIQLWKNDLL